MISTSPSASTSARAIALDWAEAQFVAGGETPRVGSAVFSGSPEAEARARDFDHSNGSNGPGRE